MVLLGVIPAVEFGLVNSVGCLACLVFIVLLICYYL